MHGEFFGVSSGASEPVYARAAILNEEGTRPSLSGDLLVDAYRRFKRGDDATDLILVASNAALALLVALPPGLTLAGVIAEEDVLKDEKSSRIPVISGLAGARQQIVDGDLVILDPEQARVLVEPDAEEFARLQADRDRRPRVYIDSSHVPARTQAGREVAVWASVRTEQDLADAVLFGADGFFFGREGGAYLNLDESGTDESALLEPDPSAPRTDALFDKQQEALLGLSQRIGGGDVAIVADITQIDLALLFMAAARCSLRWAAPLDSLSISPAELRAEIEDALRNCQRDETSPPQRRIGQTMPILAAFAETNDVGGLDLSAFEELIVPARTARSWTIADTFTLPLLRMIIDTELDTLPFAIAIGAAGVIVLPEHVHETKDFIRAQEY